MLFEKLCGKNYAKIASNFAPVYKICETARIKIWYKLYLHYTVFVFRRIGFEIQFRTLVCADICCFPMKCSFITFSSTIYK